MRRRARVAAAPAFDDPLAVARPTGVTDTPIR